MGCVRFREATRFKLFGPLMLLMLLAAMACAPSDIQLIEGILQNVDSVNGEITIVTKDGKTVTLTIATQAPIETEGASSALETLELGASLEVEVDGDGRVAQRIEVRQAKVEGVIVEIAGDEVTLESDRGRRVTVRVTDRTRIELEDDFPGTLADLQVGAEVEVKFDPDSKVAFRIDAEEEEAEIEGVVVEVSGNEVTIETERGRKLTLVVGDRTRIELEDNFPGTIADLRVGAEVEAKFDPYTRTAYKIEIEEDEAEITGVIVDIDGDEIIVETESGRRRTLAITDVTGIKLEDDFPGNLLDLREGTEVRVKFNPSTNVAIKIEVRD